MAEIASIPSVTDLLRHHLARGANLLLVEVDRDGLHLTFADRDSRRPFTEHLGRGPFLAPSAEGFPTFAFLEQSLGEEFFPEAETRPEVVGPGVHELPLGPVRADVAESIRLKLTVLGDEIHKVVLVNGWKRRGLVELLRGMEVDEALALVERITGTNAFSFALAFTLAVESAVGTEVPPAEARRRAMLSEWERLFSHLGDLALVAGATGLSSAQADLLDLKETALRAAQAVTGHRYMRGALRRPAHDSPFPEEASRLLLRTARTLRRTFVDVWAKLMRTTSFLDRLHGAGRLTPHFAQIGATGPVAKAMGEPFDVRFWVPYGDYADALDATTPVVEGDGDAYARVMVRAREVEQSLALVEALLARPAGQSVPPPLPDGLGAVESPRGTLTFRVALAGGRLDRAYLLTPAQRNWPLLPHALENGNILQDFAIVEQSFALPVAELDL